MFKVNKKYIRTMFCIFIINFEQVSLIIPVFFIVSEQVNAGSDKLVLCFQRHVFIFWSDIYVTFCGNIQ